MITTTVHLSEKDYKMVKAMATFEEMNVSEFMRKTILEQLEDKLDYKAAWEFCCSYFIQRLIGKYWSKGNRHSLCG
ncbi:DUF6290 family protein [Tetragenococcus halophilus]|uniref:type II toxin-antitoxin system RelB family antitoxin n=1 Tax=Tetragenococcus halophilus TaxID=51669 RepID=UPI001F2BD869|nr:DUF6290 family protein [Tetragenococcus halophilus]MCF1685735.1 DUF6290 family protein [Tetragenococcus halophilus]